MNQLPRNRFHVQIPDQHWFEENIGCENACPVNTRAPQYISAIRKGDDDLAFELNRGDNLFPAILGRICVHPCEDEVPEGSSHRSSHLDLLVKEGLCRPQASPRARTEKRIKKKGKKVAIIGAGPSGLSAANDLARLGYSVTIYETFPIPGGMLNVGIPPYRLPREVVQQAIEEIKRLGVEIMLSDPHWKRAESGGLEKGV